MQWSTLLLSALPFLTPVFAAPVPAPMDALDTRTTSSPGLATWLWDSSVVSDSSKSSDFISFAQTQGVKRVYANADSDIHWPVWQSFIKQCNTSGIAVEALIGNAQWVIGEGTPTLASKLEWIQWYQGNNTDASANLAGIHMDVEPWSLDDWSLTNDDYIKSWQDIVDQVLTFGKAHSLPVAADLPFWANTFKSPTTGQTMDVYMLSKLDSVTFMTYRNSAAGVVSLASGPLAAAKAAGKQVYLAVETKTAGEESLISYVVKTVSNLSSDLKTILGTSSLTSTGCFSGIAVHDYSGWKELSG